MSGLVSGVCFSDFGHDVVCVDKDPAKIEKLKRGEIPIFEPGLDVLLAKNVKAGRLTFTLDIAAAVAGADAVFIAVGTPTRRGDGHADLTYVMAAAAEIGARADGLCRDRHQVDRAGGHQPPGRRGGGRGTARRRSSTWPRTPNSCARVRRSTISCAPTAWSWASRASARKAVMADIYRPLFLRDFPIVYTGLESAEMIKYAANAFLATKITFINEIAALCEKVGADIKAVSRGMGLDGRIGNKFLHAGPGYGGSCFPKDTKALARIGQEHAVPMQITETVIKVNDEIKRRMVDKIVDLCGGEVRDKTIAVLGVTFKPNTDDMRDAPSLTIVPALVGAGARCAWSIPKGFREGERAFARRRPGSKAPMTLRRARMPS